MKKLSDKKACEIVSFHYSSYGFTIADLARHFKLPYKTVYGVFHNKKYQHLFSFKNAIGSLISTQP